VEITSVTNSDDTKFDDIQNPDDELDLSMFIDDEEKVELAEDAVIDIVDTESIDPGLTFQDSETEMVSEFSFDNLIETEDLPFEESLAEDSVVELDFPGESLLGENISVHDDLDVLTAGTVEPQTLDVVDDLVAVSDDMAEVVPIVEDKKAKKAREKAEKAQAIAQAKADKVAAKAQAKADKVAAKSQAKTDKVEAEPIVEDKKAKKAREKAEKAQAIAQAKADKAAAKAQAKAEKGQTKPEKAKIEKPPTVEKPQKADKPPKAKKEKKPKEPGEKQPQNMAVLAFMGCLLLMLLAFGGVNAYAVMKYGIGGAMFFLVFFDLLAAGALVIPIMLRRSKNTITVSDVGMGIAAISLIVGCMFVLVNLAYNLN